METKLGICAVNNCDKAVASRGYGIIAEYGKDNELAKRFPVFLCNACKDFLTNEDAFYILCDKCGTLAAVKILDLTDQQKKDFTPLLIRKECRKCTDGVIGEDYFTPKQFALQEKANERRN